MWLFLDNNNPVAIYCSHRSHPNLSRFLELFICTAPQFRSSSSVNCTDSPTDIVFVIDKSNSITNYGFEVYKQLVSDVVSMLPTGGSVRVAMVSFSVEASIVFEFTNDPSSSDILGDIFSGKQLRDDCYD